jgi:MurNAc alpha-1-phosphate uridylyltransferase
MILAAGRGERLRPLTDLCPKPMVEVLGKPLIQYHLEKLSKAGIRKVIINQAWLGEMIESYFGDGSSFELTIHYSKEDMALETGGGIVKALPLLGEEPFLVINGDVYCDIDFGNLPRLKDQDVGHLFLVKNPDFHANGDFSLDGDRVMKKKDLTYTFCGIGIYHPKMFQDAPAGAFPLPQLWRRWIDNQQISGELIQDFWADIGTVERLEELRNTLKK